MTSHVRNGRGAVRPYLFGPLELPAFLREVFGAGEVERHDMGAESAHIELAIGDSVVVVEAGQLPPDFEPTIASVYVYVENVDATYSRSIQAGAEAISEPEDKHYGERGAAFRDSGANTWYISTFKS